jgi:hypothetical protein
MGHDEEASEPKEPTPTPGEPLRPDPGYPETRGGTRDQSPRAADDKKV